MALERGFEVDHSTINRRILAYALVIETRQRQFRPPHCGSVGIDETYVKSRGTWRYLYCAIDKHGNPIDLALTAKRDLDAVKRFFRKMLKVSRCSRRKRSALMGPIPFLQRSTINGRRRWPPAPWPDSLFYQASSARCRGRPFPGEEKHAQDRRLPILPDGMSNDRGFGSNAVAEEGLRLHRRLNRQ